MQHQVENLANRAMNAGRSQLRSTRKAVEPERHMYITTTHITTAHITTTHITATIILTQAFYLNCTARQRAMSAQPSICRMAQNTALASAGMLMKLVISS